MKFKHTQASLLGKQTLWSCAYCGAVICTIERGKPHGQCPSCEHHQWHSVDAPTAMFAEVNDGI